VDAATLGGEGDQLDAAVLLRGGADGEAALFEAVDDAGDVGGIAVQEGGDLTHRLRLLECAQSAEGGGPQAELAGDCEKRRRVYEPHERAPGLASNVVLRPLVVLGLGLGHRGWIVISIFDNVNF
jgi:hypothetical protein